jgi:hypothetical protein
VIRDHWKQTEVSVELRKRTRRATATAIATLVCASSPCLAAQLKLRKVVDSADPVPGASGATWWNVSPFFDVAMDGDGLAFIGRSQSLGDFREGVYVYRGGSQPLQLITDSEGLRPGTSERFANFLRVDMDEGVVAFTNQDLFHGGGGAYRHDATGLHVVADDRTVIPGQAPERFASYGDIAIHDGTVIFGGGAHQHNFIWHQDGLYVSAQGVLGAVVDSSTPIPGGAGNFDLVGEVGLAAGGFAFARPRANNSTNDGVYRNLGAGVEVVADLSTVSPFSGTPFSSFPRFSRDAGATAIVGEVAGYLGIYLAEDGKPLRAVATTQTPYPGAGRNFVNFFNPVANSAGRVAFMGFWNPPGQFSRVGLFVANGTQMVKITEYGAQLDGKVVADIELSEQGFDWPNLAFTVRFEDGSHALYLASFEGGCIPGSTTLCLHGSRFEAKLDWRSPPGFPEQRPAFVSALSTAQSGFFYFVGAENLELMAKVLDACGLNNRYWVFAAAATNVEYTLTVTDTTTDAVRTYHNTLGQRSPAVNDTDAFPCP